jgi:hypothetical protein
MLLYVGLCFGPCRGEEPVFVGKNRSYSWGWAMLSSSVLHSRSMGGWVSACIVNLLLDHLIVG